MWPFSHKRATYPESEAAVEASERSLQEAQAGALQADTKLAEARRVKEQIRAHNVANNYSDWIEGIVLGRLSDGRS
ncbi:DUF7620 family protein [Streptomyces prasinus]|uniref:DUF7620 family protein n=1 Tax=Streptomyces prasinus TaxID=67345 RepID=UPI0033BEFBB6